MQCETCAKVAAALGGVVLCLLLGGVATAGPSLSWQARSKMLTGKGGQVCGIVGGKVLAAGGTYWSEGVKHWTDEVDIYDPGTDTWGRGPALPLQLSYGGGGAVNDRLYVCSGSDGEKDYKTTVIVLRLGRRYDFIRGPELPSPRLYCTSVVVGTKLFLIGGAPDNKLEGKVYNDILILDTADLDAGWKASRRMPGAGMTLMAAAAVGDMIYVFGGYGPGTDGLRNYDCAFSYDTVKDRWRRLPSFPYAVRCPDAVAVGGQVYIMGGYVTWPSSSGKPESFTDQVSRFDPQAETYSEAGKLPIPNCGCNPLLLKDGRVYVSGGEDKMKHRTDLCAMGMVVGK